MFTLEKKTPTAEQKNPEHIKDSVNFAPLRIACIAMNKIAKTTENQTFINISRELINGINSVYRYIRTVGEDPAGIDLFIDGLTLPRYDTDTVDRDGKKVEVIKKTFPAIFSSDTAEVFSHCREGYLFPQDEQGEYMTDPTDEQRITAGYKELNRYIWRQRSNRWREVLTPYTYEQIENAIGEDDNGQTFETPIFACTETPWKKTVRRIFEGLTDTEKEKGIEDFDSPVILAVREVSATFSPVQLKIAEYLSDGYSTHGIANKMYQTPAQKAQGKRADTKTTKEHIKRIEKKLSNNPVIMEELKKTSREKAPAPVIRPDILDTIQTPQGEYIPVRSVIQYICGIVRAELSKTPYTENTAPAPIVRPQGQSAGSDQWIIICPATAKKTK